MKLSLLVFVLAATANSGMAAILNGLCDTGQNNNCATPIATGGVTDPHFTVTLAPPGVGIPNYAASTFGVANAGWYTSGGNPLGTADADWITAATGQPLTNPTSPGNYNYQETLTAGYSGLVTISGFWAADNCGTIEWGTSSTGVSIGGGIANCTSTDQTPFDTLHAFSFQENVTLDDTYDLNFTVGNTGSATGLLVTGLTATAPEPLSKWLTLTGLLVVCASALWRRRQRIAQT